MEFLGFENNDFDFFKKKSTLAKTELDTMKESVKRHFREFCYQVQKNYHSLTGGALLLDKDFKGLTKNKAKISAASRVENCDIFKLNISIDQDWLSINLLCPPDGDYRKFQDLKLLINEKSNIFSRFFKENKGMYISLFSRTYNKQGGDTWTEVSKFQNFELIYEDFTQLCDQMEKIQPYAEENKKFGGISIGMHISKADAVRLGKVLPQRACAEVIKLLKLCDSLKLN